jgi:hypothetical protein|tara:strand:- start:131 stop:451 length:321 start_codon:yes stop_codon:yes gene_type:complete
MKIKAGNYCPLLQKECIGLQCAWITQIRGMDPQTGEDVDEWDCAIKWLPFLLIENTKKNIESGAAVESFRNEVVQRMDKPMPVSERTMQTINESIPINIKNILKDQ